jgi:hypothetical protein
MKQKVTHMITALMVRSYMAIGFLCAKGMHLYNRMHVQAPKLGQVSNREIQTRASVVS